jgi:2-methylisocitrate lyase-like PEP mutase family enzyme
MATRTRKLEGHGRIVTPTAHEPGDRLRAAVRQGIVPLIGVYDAFSASLAARHFDGLFLSGFRFACGGRCHPESIRPCQ